MTAIYATVSDVQAKLPWLGTLGASTYPTSTQVQTWLNRGEEIINAYCQTAGFSVPFTAGSAQASILADKLVLYVEGHIRQSRDATSTGEPNDDGLEQLDRFDSFLRELVENRTHWGAVLGAGAAPSAAVLNETHATYGVDGDSIADDDFAPVITKTGTTGSVGGQW